MNFQRVTRTLLYLAAIAALAAPAVAQDQRYPERPVRIVVPTAPAGGFDFVGRLVGEKLAGRLGQNVVVENLAGAGTLVGTKAAANAEANGYTLLVGGLSNLVFNVGLYPKRGYEPLTDFTPLGIVYAVPYVLVARKDLPEASLGEIVAAVRAKPDRFTIATAGTGTGQDVMAKAFLHLAGVDMTRVGYRGSNFVYPDLIAGRVDLYFDTLQTVLPQAQSGLVRIIATTSARRSAAIPDVPTMAEAGLPALTLDQGSWFGLFAPGRTPPAVVEWLRRELAVVARDPALTEKFAAGGGEATYLDAAQTANYIRAETEKWAGIMAAANIRAD